MPGSARRVRAAYSRTLCLPCLRQVFCAFNTTATKATMSSESFLPISDDVCSFGEALLHSIFPVSSLLHRCAHRLYTGPTRLIWSFAGVASLPWPQTATQGRPGPSLKYLSKSEFTPPPKGGGAGSCSTFGSLDFQYREARCFFAGKDGHLVSEGFSRQLPLATAAYKRLTRLQQGRSGVSMVLLPYPVP